MMMMVEKEGKWMVVCWRERRGVNEGTVSMSGDVGVGLHDSCRNKMDRRGGVSTEQKNERRTGAASFVDGRAKMKGERWLVLLVGEVAEGGEISQQYLSF